MADDVPTSLNCPTCGAPLDADGSSALVRCKFCGNTSLLPRLEGQGDTTAASLEEIRQLAARGNVVEALSKYRERYGIDLQNSQDAVEALREGRLASQANADQRSREELTRAIKEAQRLMKAGDKIGAIKVYRQTYDVSLARAKYAVEQIEAGETLQPEAGFVVTRAPQAETSSRTSQWVALIVVLAILLIIGGALVSTFIRPGGPLTPHYYPTGHEILLPAQNGVDPAISLALYDSGKDTRFIGLINAASNKLAWASTPLPGDGYVDALAAGPDTIFAASGTDLLAYRRSDGTVAWQVQMSDQLNYGETSLLITAVRVVTSNNDSTIQAYNIDNGSPVWNMRLTGYDRKLRQVGGSLMVVDYVNNENNFGLIFLNLLTGKQENAFLPTCTYNDYDINISPDSGFIYNQDEKALYIVYDSSYGCVQKIDAETGDVLWSTASADSYNFASDGFHYLLSDSTLYFENGGKLMAVDRTSGETKVLVTNEDYDLLPLSIQGDTLIVRAKRTRGTTKFILWGVNAANGETAWQLDMQSAEPIQAPDVMSGLVDKTDHGFGWTVTPAGLVLLTFQGEPNQMTLDTVGLSDGKSLGSQVIPLNNVSGDFYGIPSLIGSNGNVLYLDIDQGLYSLDVTTAKLKKIY